MKLKFKARDERKEKKRIDNEWRRIEDEEKRIGK